MQHQIITADCLQWMKSQPDDSVDLIVGSPPYSDQRTYSIGFELHGESWVAWMIERIREMVRISRGLVAMVVEGKTEKFAYCATPYMLVADLKRSGIHLRKPVTYHRVGIPGSGGPDWFRNDTELVICCSKGRKLPWSNNVALGQPPKYGPGGVPSHRLKDGTRANERKMREMLANDATLSQRASPRLAGVPFKSSTSGLADDFTSTQKVYIPPTKANPGNLIQQNYSSLDIAEILEAYESGDTVHAAVGGGKLGSKLSHSNEAPFPEKLPEFFIRSCCPPNGIVLDPFGGSGTTMAVAAMNGRRSISIDIRADQAELMQRRKAEAYERLLKRADSPHLQICFARLIQSIDETFEPTSDLVI